MACVFVCGADMAPGLVRARFPDGQFTGIGWIDGSTIPEAGVERIWGLVIEGAEVDGQSVVVTRRDGSEVSASLASSAEDFANAEAVTAQRRYWELPESLTNS